jgi:hypothetical protein
MLMWTMAAASPISAQTIMGAGTVSCGEWLRLRSFENNPGTNFKELASNYQLRAWIDGFLSGINVANSGRDADFLASTPDGAAMRAYVDNYCRSKPLGLVADAATALVKELQSRAERK